MRIDDYDSACDVTRPADIEAALSKRHGDGINSFWLSHGGERYPAINIMVKRDLAAVHYLPKDRDAGFVSVARVPGLRPNETSIFFVGLTEKIWVPNDQLVPFSDALKVAQEFAVSTTIPKCIQWFRL
jgi:Immunity protein Imm1